MTREEIAKVVKEIKEHCRNNHCKNCEAQTAYGCVFMSGYPDNWVYIVGSDKVESEEKE